MEIVSEAVDRYLGGLSAPGDATLAEMERYGRERQFPIVGPQVGRLFLILTRLIAAERILELGSGFGYSAYWFALGLPEGGRVVLTERSAENLERAHGYFEQGGLLDRMEAHTGEALDIAASLEGPFDIVFSDIDKHEYPEVLGLARTHLRPGGLLLFDNMLWGGAVLSEDADATTRGIQSLTRSLYESRDLFTTIVPVRDGVAISLYAPERE